MKGVFVIVVIFAICSLAQSTEEEFRTNVGGTDYLITFQKRNWHRAFKICKQKYMELVSITSEEQFQNVKQVIKDANHTQLEDIYWTSGIDLGNENNFFWTSNGECFSFEPWHTGQPDNAGSNENCVELRNWNNIYKLNDNNCDANNYFICSKVKDQESEPCSPSYTAKRNCDCG